MQNYRRGQPGRGWPNRGHHGGRGGQPNSDRNYHPNSRSEGYIDEDRNDHSNMYRGRGGYVDMPRGRGGAMDNHRGRGGVIDNYRGRGGAMDAYRGMGVSMDNYRGMGGGAMDNNRGNGGVIDNYRGRGGAMDGYRGMGVSMDNYRGMGGAMDMPRGRGGSMDNYRGRGGSMDTYRGRGGAMEDYRGRGGSMDNHRGRGGSTDNYRGRGGAMENYRGRAGSMDNYRGRGGSMDMPRRRGGSMQRGRGGMQRGKDSYSNMDKRENPASRRMGNVKVFDDTASETSSVISYVSHADLEEDLENLSEDLKEVRRENRGPYRRFGCQRYNFRGRSFRRGPVFNRWRGKSGYAVARSPSREKEDGENNGKTSSSVESAEDSDISDISIESGTSVREKTHPVIAGTDGLDTLPIRTMKYRIKRYSRKLAELRKKPILDLVQINELEDIVAQINAKVNLRMEEERKQTERKNMEIKTHDSKHKRKSGEINNNPRKTKGVEDDDQYNKDNREPENISSEETVTSESENEAVKEKPPKYHKKTHTAIIAKKGIISFKPKSKTRVIDKPGKIAKNTGVNEKLKEVLNEENNSHCGESKDNSERSSAVKKKILTKITAKDTVTDPVNDDAMEHEGKKKDSDESRHRSDRKSARKREITNKNNAKDTVIEPVKDDGMDITGTKGDCNESTRSSDKKPAARKKKIRKRNNTDDTHIEASSDDRKAVEQLFSTLDDLCSSMPDKLPDQIPTSSAQGTGNQRKQSLNAKQLSEVSSPVSTIHSRNDAHKIGKNVSVTNRRESEGSNPDTRTALNNGPNNIDVFKFLVMEMHSVGTIDDIKAKSQLFQDVDAHEWFRHNNRRFTLLERDGKITTVFALVRDTSYCIAYITVRSCKESNCRHYHICKNLLSGKCTFGENCKFSHNVFDDRNTAVTKRLGLDSVFNNEQIVALLSARYPRVCDNWNEPDSCPDSLCTNLHLCKLHVQRNCLHGEQCKLEHLRSTNHNKPIVAAYRMENWDDNMFHRCILLNKSPAYHEERVNPEKSTSADDKKGDDPVSNVKSVESNVSVADDGPGGKAEIRQDSGAIPKSLQMRPSRQKAEEATSNAYHEERVNPEKSTRADDKMVDDPVSNVKSVESNVSVADDRPAGKAEIRQDSGAVPNSLQMRPSRQKAEETTSNDDLKLVAESASKTFICEQQFLSGRCSKRGCCLLHSNRLRLPYIWQVKLYGAWTSVDDSCVVESSFCDPRNRGSQVTMVDELGTSHTVLIHFDDAGRLFALCALGELPARRLSTKSYSALNVQLSSFVTRWVWYWLNDDGGWQKFETDALQYTLESKYQFGQKTFLYFRHNYSFKYSIDFTTLEQLNIDTRKARTVTRRPTYVSVDDVHKGTLPSISIPRAPATLPAAWAPWDLAHPFELVELNLDDADYITVEKSFYTTLRRGAEVIDHIYRVQCAPLWSKLLSHREIMVADAERAGRESAIDERTLFHGTDGLDLVRGICINNVDPRLSGKNGTTYGVGAYFAKNAKYSHAYTGNNPAERFMFQAIVLVGDFVLGMRTYPRPPARPGAAHELYDSCVNSMSDPTVFVAFDRDQYYPEYLIQYHDNQQPDWLIQDARPAPTRSTRKPSTGATSYTSTAAKSDTSSSATSYISAGATSYPSTGARSYPAASATSYPSESATSYPSADETSYPENKVSYPNTASSRPKPVQKEEKLCIIQ